MSKFEIFPFRNQKTSLPRQGVHLPGPAQPSPILQIHRRRQTNNYTYTYIHFGVALALVLPDDSLANFIRRRDEQSAVHQPMCTFFRSAQVHTIPYPSIPPLNRPLWARRKPEWTMYQMATELTMLGPVQTSNPVNTVQTVYGPTLGGKKCFFFLPFWSKALWFIWWVLMMTALTNAG